MLWHYGYNMLLYSPQKSIQNQVEAFCSGFIHNEL